MSRDAAAQALAILTAAYRKELPKPTIRVYLSALADLDPAALAAACDEIIKASEWFPSVAEVREAALRHDPTVELPPVWQAAYREIVAAMSQIGRGGRPDWSHPAIPDAIRAVGGWYHICESTSAGVLEARLRKAYEYTADGMRRTALVGGAQATGTPALGTGEKG